VWTGVGKFADATRTGVHKRCAQEASGSVGTAQPNLIRTRARFVHPSARVLHAHVISFHRKHRHDGGRGVSNRVLENGLAGSVGRRLSSTVAPEHRRAPASAKTCNNPAGVAWVGTPDNCAALLRPCRQQVHVHIDVHHMRVGCWADS
jgi:hypothetical protein